MAASNHLWGCWSLCFDASKTGCKVYCLELWNSLQDTLRLCCNLVWKYEVSHWFYSYKSRFGRVLKGPFGPSTGIPGQDQRSVLLFLLVVTCLNSSFKSSVIKIHNFSQPLLGNMKTWREFLFPTGKCESFSNERVCNHSCGNMEFKLTSYQPETHLEPRVYLPNYSPMFIDLSGKFCLNDRILAAIPVSPTCCIGLPQVWLK